MGNITEKEIQQAQAIVQSLHLQNQQLQAQTRKQEELIYQLHNNTTELNLQNQQLRAQCNVLQEQLRNSESEQSRIKEQQQWDYRNYEQRVKTLDETIAKNMESEKRLHEYYAQQIHTFQRDIDKLQKEHYDLNNYKQQIQTLQRDIDKLQKENYDLNPGSLKVMAEFPTTENIIMKYNHLGQQRLFSFITKHNNSVPGSSASLVASFTAKTREIVQEQHNTILTQLFPSSLSSLAKSNTPLSLELFTHLQKHYKVIMDLETWCSRSRITIHELYIPQGLEMVPNLITDSTRIIKEMHDIFWQIELSRVLQFGPTGECTAELYFVPSENPSPTIVLPYLMAGDSFATQGYAF